MKNAMISLFALVLLLPLLSCGSSDNSDSTGSNDDSSSSTGCAWNGSCSSTAPNGAYDCQGNTLVQCNNGIWDSVIYCGGITNSDGYSCTCKGGCGTNTVECSYAFDICGGQQYDTCGPNADAVIADTWDCQ